MPTLGQRLTGLLAIFPIGLARLPPTAQRSTPIIPLTFYWIGQILPVRNHYKIGSDFDSETWVWLRICFGLRSGTVHVVLFPAAAVPRIASVISLPCV